MKSFKIIFNALWVAIICAIIYGIAHDMVTAHISLPYFTKGHYDILQSDKAWHYALYWGVVSTWWMGAILGLIYGSICAVKDRHVTIKQYFKRYALIITINFMIAMIALVVGWLIYPNFYPLIELPLEQQRAFTAAIWAHSASYLFGVILTLILCGYTAFSSEEQKPKLLQ